MRISDWSSDVCSSDLKEPPAPWITAGPARLADMTAALNAAPTTTVPRAIRNHLMSWPHCYLFGMGPAAVSRRYSRRLKVTPIAACTELLLPVTTLKTPIPRSEEHTSELQSLMRISYAVFCLKKKILNTDAIHILKVKA